jgi:alpha-tubulin suppressor-like RCC1 family protein
MAKWYEVTAGVTALLALGACGGSMNSGSADNSARHAQGGAVATPEVLADENRLAAGQENTAGLSADGKVYVWGRNDAGQAVLAPVLVSGLSDVKSIKSGGLTNLVLKQDGTVWTVSSRGVQLVTGLSNVKAIAVGQAHMLALAANGNVWGWGRGGATSTTPAIVAGLSNVKSIAAGQDYSVALAADGKVWTWGNNLFGQLGNGTTGRSSAPAAVAGVSNAASIAAGMAHVLVLKQDGTVWGWGNNSYGQLGGTTPAYYTPIAVKGLPVPVPGMSGVRSVSAGAYNSGIVNYNGSVWTWGNNTFGQLGDGTTAVSFAPKKVNAISDAAAMAIGAGHIAVLRNDGAVYSFGRNTAGQLGNNTTVGSNLPVQAVGAGGIGNLNLGKSANR